MENAQAAEDTSPIEYVTDNKASHKPPWNPALIATITILFSVLPGGIFHALNYERLGLPQKKITSLTTNLLLSIFIFMASMMFYEIRFGLFQLVFHIACANHFYKSQATLFQKQLANTGTKASMGFPLFVSFLLFLAIIGITFGLASSRY